MCVESSGRVFDHLSVDSSRVCRFSSFKLVDGAVEFLHRERLHCVLVLLVLVLVFAFVFLSSSLTCRAPRGIPRTHPQYPVCRICCAQLCTAREKKGFSCVSC